MGSESRLAFSKLLNETRMNQHMSLSRAAAVAGVHKATLQGWLNGRYFPTPALRANYLALVRSLGLESALPDDLWDDIAAGPQVMVRAAPTTPYLGLRPFSVADRDVFFGRAAAAHRLAGAIRELHEADGTGVIVLVGPSGSGKSSLLAAGIAATECVDGELAGFSVDWFSPAGPEPGEGGAEAGRSTRLVLADQFEDVLRQSPEDRGPAIRRLVELARRAIVVIALRADAWAEASEIPELEPGLSRPVLLSPLSRAELREVIVEPARLLEVEVAPELLKVLEDDLAAGVARTISSDVLPLLSTALLATWTNSRGRRMSVTDYVAAGGVGGAIGSMADQALAGLDPEDRAAAAGLFLRLVRVTDTSVAREPVMIADLSEQDRRVMAPFVAARLLTLTETAVQISHDALIDHWAQLDAWIQTHRDDLRVRQQLQAATQLWLDSGRSPALLVPVSRLGVIQGWLDSPNRESLISPQQRAYLDASEEHFAGVLHAEQASNRRLRRRGRLAIASAALTTTLAIVASTMFARAQTLQTQADAARLDAQSRQVATAARSIRANDPNLEAQMAVVAGGLSDTLEGRSALLDAAATDVPLRWLGSPAAVVAVNDQQDLVARVNGSGELTLWRGDELTRSSGTTTPLDPSGSPLYAVALARVGGRDLLAAGGSVAGVWDVTSDPVRLVDLTRDKLTTYAAAFSTDQRFVALGRSDGSVEILRLESDGSPTKLADLQINEDDAAMAVSSLVFDDHDVLWVGGRNDSIDRWAIGDTVRRLSPVQFHYGAAPLRAVSIDVTGDGGRLVAGTTANAVLRWRFDGTGTAVEKPLSDFGSWINDVSYSPDGSQLLVGSSDQTTKLFDTASGTLLRSLDGPALVTGVQFDGTNLVTASSDGALRVWAGTSRLVRSSGGAMYNLATDASGSKWLAGGTLTEGVDLWRLEEAGTPRPVTLTYPELSGARSAAVAVAPDGGFLVAASKVGEIVTWPLGPSGPGAPTVIQSGIGYISCLTISPDSRLVAAMGYGGKKAALLRAGEGGALTPLSQVDAMDAQMGSFSADSSVLAIALAANRVELWTGVDTPSPTLSSSIADFSTATIAIAAAPQQPLVAVGEDSGQVSVWSLTDPAHPVRTHLFGDAHASAYALTFSPDERTVLAATGDDLIWGWDLAGSNSSARYALSGELDRPWDVKYLNNGTTIAASGNNGHLRLWPATLAHARSQICRGRGTPLTAEEWKRYLAGIDPADPC
jgi:WD40 repeat protein